MRRPRTWVPVTADDYRRLARRRLPRFLFDYVDGGAGREETLAWNRNDFTRYRLRQRVMRDVSGVDTSTRLLGQEVALPLALAPVGMAGMMARRGEVQAAVAAERAGVPFTLSTVGICPVEEIHRSVATPCWFQLYMLRDRGLVQSILQRVWDAGCRTLLFTVDLPIPGPRHRDRRTGMLGGAPLARPAQLLTRPRWLFDVGIRGKPHNFAHFSDHVARSDDFAAYLALITEQFDPTVTWKDIAWLRSTWRGQLVIKGVMSAEDARSAVDVGADGVVVSNHGARQLDGVSSSISKLGEVAQAVGDRASVLMDGGVRSGIDLIRAVALGADAVLIGRPWVWAVAARGAAGLSDYLATLRQEVATCMTLMGVNRIGEIGPELIEREAP